VVKVEKITNPELIEVLKRNRKDLNDAFYYYKNYFSYIDEEYFLKLFKKYAEYFAHIILRDYKHKNESFLSEKITQLYNFLLEVLAKNIFIRNDKIENLFYNIIQNLCRLFIENSEDMMRKTINILINLSNVSDAVTTRWYMNIVKYKDVISSPEDYYRIGVISAWISGLANYREESIKILETLGEDKIIKIFNNKSPDLNMLKSNYWYTPFSDKGRIYFKTAGKFSGFGGEFNEPPVIRLYNDDVFVEIKESFYKLHFDFYGEYFEQIQKGGFDSTINDVDIKFTDEKIVINNKYFFQYDKITSINDVVFFKFNRNDIKSIVFFDNTLLYTLKNSFKIYFLGMF